MRNRRKDQLIKLYREVMRFFTKRTASRQSHAAPAPLFSTSYTTTFPYIQSLSSSCNSVLCFRQKENRTAAVYYSYKYNFF